jgi:hypothetical protein
MKKRPPRKPAKGRRPRWSPVYAVDAEHPVRRRGRPLKALADRPGYPFPDRATALRIVAASQRAASPQGDTYLQAKVQPAPPV